MEPVIGVVGAEELALTAASSDNLTDRQRKVFVDGWKKQENSYTTFSFTGETPGPATPSAGESWFSYFDWFFTSEVWDLLVTETNRFAAQSRANITSPRRGMMLM